MVKPSRNHVNNVNKGVESGKCIDVGMEKKEE